MNQSKIENRKSKITRDGGYFQKKRYITFLCIVLFTLPDGGYASDTPKIKYLFSVDGFSEGYRFSSPQGIYFDSEEGEIYVADTGNNKIDIFDSKGFPIFQFGKGVLISPFDLVVRRGKIYVSQQGKGYIEVFNYRGKSISRIYPPGGKGEPFYPGRLALDDEGNLYVVEVISQKILIFDKEDRFKFSFGGVERFSSISGIFVRARRIYVTDSGGKPIHVFDMKGKFLREMGKRGEKKEDFSFTGNLYVDKEERLWVIDNFRHHLKVFDKEGRLLFHYGTYGMGPGELLFPVDIDFNKETMYILEKGTKRLSIFRVEVK